MNIACDILVIGAGVSGISAALASARSGIRTVVVEKEGFIGGAGYSGLLQQICGLYLNGRAVPEETLNDGIVREVVSGLHRLSPRNKVKKIGQVYVLPYLREDLSSVFNSMCRAENRLSVMLNTSLVSVKKKKGKVVEVALSDMNAKSPRPHFTKGGIRGTTFNITPKVLIDCSGDGAAAVMAGADYKLSPLSKRQLAGFIIHLKGLNTGDETLPVKVPYYLSEAAEVKRFPSYARYTTFSYGDVPDEGYLKINPGHEYSRRGPVVLNRAAKILGYLAEKLPSFRHAHIAGTSLKVMDREGRRICGEYTLTEDDILNAGKFDDGVVKNSWPIELWDRNKGTVYKYLRDGEYYEIPFRCLKVKGLSNLLCAGRCISVTREALGSTRVMGTCMSLGEQAGLAAAYYVKNGRYPYSYT
ncbi:MAG: FAD-dependent oxidoreductase [Nitrospirae bacterium]|nr:FAD-dependent oxidoreductase [Nitrospirota bacterium]